MACSGLLLLLLPACQQRLVTDQTPDPAAAELGYMRPGEALGQTPVPAAAAAAAAAGHMLMLAAAYLHA
jgi:hypothetical protein